MTPKWTDHTWYVLGKSGIRNGVSAFRLNRIKELTTLEKCFIQDEQFDIREYLALEFSRPLLTTAFYLI